MEIQIRVYKINIKSNEIDLDIIRTNDKTTNVENHLYDSDKELRDILYVIDNHYGVNFSYMYKLEKAKNNK